MTQRKLSHGRGLKKERIKMCITAWTRRLFRRATAVSAPTAGDLAYDGLRRAPGEHESMVLAGADRDAFLAALLNPPAPTAKLVAALKRHRDLFE